MKGKLRSVSLLLAITMLFLFSLLSLTPAMTYRPPLDYYTEESPYYVYTFLGEYVSGDVDSLQTPNDGDVYYCKGVFTKLGSIKWIPIFAWQGGCSAFFEDPGTWFTTNRVTMRYRYVGDYPMHITIYYTGGGVLVDYVSSTGSSYVQVTYDVGSHIVYAVSFDHKTSPFTQPHIYVDYIKVFYERVI